MADRPVSIANIGYQHKDRDHDEGYIYAMVSLDYLNYRPGTMVKLSQDEALRMAGQLILAVQRERATY